MTLRKISIRGFKSIERAEVELQALNVLIGPNGAGKSNFVGVFELLREVVERRLQSYVLRKGGADRLLRFGRKRTQSIVIDLFLEPHGYHLALEPSEGNDLFILHETCRSDELDPSTLDLSITQGSARESGLRERAERAPGDVVDQVFRAISSWRVYHFHDTSSSAKVKQLCDIGDMHALRPDASNLAAFLYRLQRASRQSFELIVRTVQRVAPFFERFELRPLPANQEMIGLAWVERGSDAHFSAHALSDGTLRFICLATLLLQPELPSVILLDEPELGLHPHAITLLAGLLRRAAHHTQLLVATQSVTLLDQLAPENVIVVERDHLDGTSSFRRLTSNELDDWLDSYSLGELWQKNIIGGYPE